MKALARRSGLLRRRALAAAGATLGLLLAGGAAQAQVVMMSTTDAYYDWRYQIEGGPRYQLPVNVNGGGRFDAWAFDVDFTAGGPFAHNLRLFFTTGYGYTRYDFRDTVGTTCAPCFEQAPWAGIHRFDIAPGGALVLSEGLQVVAMVPLRVDTEGSATRNPLTAGLVVAVRIQLDDSFRASLGVGVQSELEEDPSVHPVVALDWRLSDSLRVRTEGGPYLGGLARLEWGTSRTLAFLVESGWERRRFRLNEGAPGFPNGVGEHTSVPLLFGMRFSIRDAAAIELKGGMAVAGRLERDDSKGRTVVQEDYATAGLLRAQLSIRF